MLGLTLARKPGTDGTTPHIHYSTVSSVMGWSREEIKSYSNNGTPVDAVSIPIYARFVAHIQVVDINLAPIYNKIT